MYFFNFSSTGSKANRPERTPEASNRGCLVARSRPPREACLADGGRRGEVGYGCHLALPPDGHYNVVIVKRELTCYRIPQVFVAEGPAWKEREMVVFAYVRLTVVTVFFSERGERPW
jgi:hypothetical protein